MPFFDVGSEFLGFDQQRNCETLARNTELRSVSARPFKSLPAASEHKIAAVAISHHRLPLVPPFHVMTAPVRCAAVWHSAALAP